MPNIIIFFLLIIGAYLVGSIPTSFLAAKTRGVDLRQKGTFQVGGGNLWRMTSWKLGLPVSIFDFAKGALMMWAAQSCGLDAASQLMVGTAAITGHNWPVFLHFHGGRGLGTTLGVASILPFINDVTPWPPVALWGFLLIGRLLLGSSPLAALIGVLSLPIVSGIFGEGTLVVLAFVAIFLIMAIKRLTAQPCPETTTIKRSELLINRLFLDRDIRDNKSWMYRNSKKAVDD